MTLGSVWCHITHRRHWRKVADAMCWWVWECGRCGRAHETYKAREDRRYNDRH